MSSGDDGVRSVNRWVAAGFGLLWLIGGAAALVVSRHSSFTSSKGAKLRGGFDANGLHGALMVLAGIFLLAGAVQGARAARRANLVVGSLWLVLDPFALLVGHRTINVLAIHDHDADLLLIASLALLAVGLVLDLPKTSGSGPKYRSVRHGAGPVYVDASDVPGAVQSPDPAD